MPRECLALPDGPIALYFGSLGDGHFLYSLVGGRVRTIYAPEEVDGFPWTWGQLDARLLQNRKVKDDPDGRVHWTCGGRKDFWHVFFWWDRSKDRRGNS